MVGRCDDHRRLVDGHSFHEEVRHDARKFLIVFVEADGVEVAGRICQGVRRGW